MHRGGLSFSELIIQRRKTEGRRGRGEEKGIQSFMSIQPMSDLIYSTLPKKEFIFDTQSITRDEIS